MKSRRDFLAALGSSAGALGLPGTARAWFGRRRRVSCAPACQPHSQCADAPCGDCDAECGVACPSYLYSVINNTYYYYCHCCLNVNESIVVPTNTPVTVPMPVPCAQGEYCFQVAPPGITDFHRATGPAACAFVHDATNPVSRAQVSIPYRDGIDAKDAKVLHEQLVSGGPNAGLNVNSLAYVQYADAHGVTHTAALYDLSRDGASRPLYVGQEVTGTPVGGLKPQIITGVTEVPGFPHYHRVNRFEQGPTYHVAVKK